jgi:hypothetical protein
VEALREPDQNAPAVGGFGSRLRDLDAIGECDGDPAEHGVTHPVDSFLRCVALTNAARQLLHLGHPAATTFVIPVLDQNDFVGQIKVLLSLHD